MNVPHVIDTVTQKKMNMWDLKNRRVAMTLKNGTKVLGRVSRVKETRSLSIMINVKGVRYESTDIDTILAL